MERFPNGIDIALDGRYNNRYTPSVFQAGTQVIFTTAEQNSEDKKIVDYAVYNKNCPEALKLLSAGQIDKITCPDPDNKTHNCQANIACSGRKRVGYAANAAASLKKSGVHVNTVTS